MKRPLGKGSERDSLPSIDQLTGELINGLYRWRCLLADRQPGLPSLHRRASQHGLHVALRCCFEFLKNSTRSDALTYERRQLSGLVRAACHEEGLPTTHVRRLRVAQRIAAA